MRADNSCGPDTLSTQRCKCVCVDSEGDMGNVNVSGKKEKGLSRTKTMLKKCVPA